MKNTDNKVNLSDFAPMSKISYGVRIPNDVLDRFLQCSKLRKKIYLAPDERKNIKDFDVLLSNCLFPNFDVDFRLNDVMEFGEVIPRSLENLVTRMMISQVYSILTQRIVSVVENYSTDEIPTLLLDENLIILRKGLDSHQQENYELTKFIVDGIRGNVVKEDHELSVDIQFQSKILKFSKYAFRSVTLEGVMCGFREKFWETTSQFVYEYNIEGGVVAKKHFKPGEIILVESSVVYSDERNRCQSCLYKSSFPLPCPGCRDEIFCKRNCMRDNNKTSCQFGLRRAADLIEDVWDRRIFYLAMKFIFSAKRNDLEKFDKEGSTVDEDVHLMAGLIWNIFRNLEFTNDKELNMDIIVNVVHRVKISMLELHDYEFDVNDSNRFVRNTVGYGFNASASRIRHSCINNASILRINNKVVYIALRSIKKNQEITLNYVDNVVKADTNERQMKYRQRFGNDCQCSACKNQLSPSIFLKIEDRLKKVWSAKEKKMNAKTVQDCMQQKDWEGLLKFRKSQMETLEKRLKEKEVILASLMEKNSIMEAIVLMLYQKQRMEELMNRVHDSKLD